MTDSAYTKMIDCPAHPNGRLHWWDPRTHKAILFCHGGAWEGIWECPRSGESDSCEHEERHIENIEVTYFSTPDIDSSYNVDVYVCDNCGMDIPIDEASPAEDRADYIADMQIMEALGK